MMRDFEDDSRGMLLTAGGRDIECVALRRARRSTTRRHRCTAGGLCAGPDSQVDMEGHPRKF